MVSQHSQYGPRPRITTRRLRPAKPACPDFGDIRDELGKVDGCTCEPAEKGHYSGAVVYNCPVHQDEYVRLTRRSQKPWFSIPTPKEHWQYQGAGPWDGRRCYFFRREHIGIGGTTKIIPIDEYWAGCTATNGEPCT